MNKQSLKRSPLNVIITGVGGQGNVLLTKLLGRALVKKGYTVTVGDIYGAAQRGGSVSSHIRISEKDLYSPLTPHGTAHLIVSLEPVEALRAIGEWGNPEVVVISNTRPSYPFDVTSGNARYPRLKEIQEAVKKFSKEAFFVDASDIALELGAPVVTNIVMGGAVIGTGMLPISQDDFRQELKDQFAAKAYELNRKAFARGVELTSGK
jgi:indolepyruvate ferredoxin oxidoreductase beta subunit